MTYPIGTIRVWSCKKYKKVSYGKWQEVTDKKTRNSKKLFLKLCDVLSKNKKIAIKNKVLGDVYLEQGQIGRGGWGLKHIIEQRTVKDKRNIKDITAMICLIANAVHSGIIKTNNNDRATIVKNGIMAVIAKRKRRTQENWVLTGYDLFSEKQKATDAIKSVNDKYGYTPAYRSLSKQVGAVANGIINKNANMSSDNTDRQKSIQKAFNETQHPRDDKGRFTDKGETTETRLAKIKRIAKTTKLIKGISPLEPTNSNIKQVLNDLRNMSRAGLLKCRCLGNRRVVVNTNSINHHFFKVGQKKRTLEEIKTRGMLLPYVATILNDTSVVAEKDIKRQGSYGIVGRAMVGGIETAIKIVLQSKTDSNLLYLSIIRIGEIKKSIMAGAIETTTRGLEKQVFFHRLPICSYVMPTTKVGEGISILPYTNSIIGNNIKKSSIFNISYESTRTYYW